MAEEGRFGRGIRRKDVLERHTGRVSDVCRRWGERTCSVVVPAPFSSCHLTMKVVLPDHIIVSLAFGPS